MFFTLFYPENSGRGPKMIEKHSSDYTVNRVSDVYINMLKRGVRNEMSFEISMTRSRDVLCVRRIANVSSSDGPRSETGRTHRIMNKSVSSSTRARVS